MSNDVYTLARVAMPLIPLLMALWVSETELIWLVAIGISRDAIFVPDSRLVLPREQSMLEHSRAINLSGRYRRLVDTSDAICAPGLDGFPLESRGVAT